MLDTNTLFFPAHKQVAINWCISKGTVPIPGVRSLKQAEETLGAVGWRLALAEVEALDAAAEKVPRELVQVLKIIIKKTLFFICRNATGLPCAQKTHIENHD